jgi:glucokinase
MGVAGQIDPDSGVVLDSPNLRWHNVPILDLTQRALGMPVYVTNDVRAVTWGEWKCGAGKHVSDLLCVFVGTGIGGGVIIGGRLLTGSTGVAGEVGHTVIDQDGPQCRCGSRGCLEAHAGGWAIGLRAQQAVEAEPEAGSALMALAQGDSFVITSATVAEAAHAGDPLALRLVAETGVALGVGVASLVNLFNPRLVILGGGVMEGLPELIGTVAESVQARALPAHRAAVDVVGAKLGRYSGTVGAALMARELLTG